MLKLIIITTFILSLCSALSIAGPIGDHRSYEKNYQDHWCTKDNTIISITLDKPTEITLANRTRVDCLSDKYAIEFDFGRKWAEALGQSLHYAMFTGRTAGIVIILNSPKETNRYYNRLMSTINHYGLPITVWVMLKSELK